MQTSAVGTFEDGLDDRRRFGGQEDLFGALGQSAVVAARKHQVAQEARPVADVVVLVVLGQTATIQKMPHYHYHSLAVSVHWNWLRLMAFHAHLKMYWHNSLVCLGLDKHSLAARFRICSFTTSCCETQ